MSSRRPALIAILATLACLSGGVRGQCQYEVTAVIDRLPCGLFDWIPIGVAINEQGHVAGYLSCIGADWAFVWYGEGDPVFLPMPEGTTSCRATDINDHGEIVGWLTRTSDGYGRLAFRSDGIETTIIGPVPEGGTYHSAAAISEGGVVVGSWGNSVAGNPGSEPIVWDGGETITLPFLNMPNSRAEDVNRAGAVTGWRGGSAYFDGARAFTWDGAKAADLPKHHGWVSMAGRAINDLNHVAGTARLAEDGLPGLIRRAFLYDGIEFVDLGVLPGSRESLARDHNNKGIVVGYLTDEVTGDRAFLWNKGQMHLMSDLVLDSDDYLLGGEAINDAGQIAVSSIGRGGTIVLAPIAASPTDLDGDCLTNRDDFALLIQSWANPHPVADFDSDGFVDVDDLVALLIHWDTSPP